MVGIYSSSSDVTLETNDGGGAYKSEVAPFPVWGCSMWTGVGRFLWTLLELKKMKTESRHLILVTDQLFPELVVLVGFFFFFFFSVATCC